MMCKFRTSMGNTMMRRILRNKKASARRMASQIVTLSGMIPLKSIPQMEYIALPYNTRASTLWTPFLAQNCAAKFTYRFFRNCFRGPNLGPSKESRGTQHPHNMEQDVLCSPCCNFNSYQISGTGQKRDKMLLRPDSQSGNPMNRC